MNKETIINTINEYLQNNTSLNKYSVKCVGSGELFFIFTSNYPKYKDKVIKISKDQLFRILKGESDIERINIEKQILSKLINETNNLKQYFDKDTVLDIEIENISIDLELNILEKIFQTIGKENKTKNIELVCLTQKYIPDLENTDKYISIHTSLVRYDNYIKAKTLEEKERLIDITVEKYIKENYSEKLNDLSLKEYLKSLFLNINNYCSNTNKYLDIMGNNNLVVFKENNIWKSYLLDLIPFENNLNENADHRIKYTFEKTLEVLSIYLNT